MLTATCHCGAVRVEVPERPDTVADCRCSLCRRYGVLCWQRIVAVEGTRMGVNARNFEPEALAAARIVLLEAEKH